MQFKLLKYFHIFVILRKIVRIMYFNIVNSCNSTTYKEHCITFLRFFTNIRKCIAHTSKILRKVKNVKCLVFTYLHYIINSTKRDKIFFNLYYA